MAELDRDLFEVEHLSHPASEADHREASVLESRRRRVAHQMSQSKPDAGQHGRARWLRNGLVRRADEVRGHAHKCEGNAGLRNMWPPGDCAVRQIRAFTRSRLSTNSAQLSLIIILSAAVSRCAAADDQVARASTRTAVVRPEVTSDFR